MGDLFFFLAVFSNPLRGRSRPQSERFWAYKRSKMNHDLQYCAQESITWQITLQEGEKNTPQVIRVWKAFPHGGISDA